MISVLQLHFQSDCSRCMRLLLLFFFMVAGPGLLQAEQAAPEQVIQALSDRLKAIYAENGERLRSDPAYVYQLANEILVPHIDFAKVSSLVLGKHWQRATPGQQEAFREQFQYLLVRTYATAFKESREWELRFLPAREGNSDNDTAVRTQLVLPQANPIEVQYHMHLKDGNWMAYDVKIDGISLVTNYRSSFSQEVRAVGMDGLIKKITTLNEKRVHKNETKNS